MYTSQRLCALAALAVSAAFLGMARPAQANTLAGDWFSVSALCYGNAACSSYSASSPFTSFIAAGSPTASQRAGGSIQQTLPDGSGLVSDYENYASQIQVTLAIFNFGTGVTQSFQTGGFIGLQVAFSTTPTSGPLQVTFSDANGSNDGFTLSDVTYEPNGVVDMNFAGLTGTCDVGFDPGCLPQNDLAELNISNVEPVAAVPEPATAPLVATGLWVLVGAGWRKRMRITGA